MLFQKAQQRYTHLINTYIFVVLLLTNHETPYNLKILCWASTHLLSQSLPFLQLQVCDQQPTKHLKADHHWPASETPSEWRFAGESKVARHRVYYMYNRQVLSTVAHQIGSNKKTFILSTNVDQKSLET